jgi:hypothetical protein
MPDVDVVFRRTARDFYDNTATAAERLKVNAIIVELCRSPEVDEVRKYRMQSGDVLYHDGTFWILYRALNNWTIEVLGIGTVADHS